MSTNPYQTPSLPMMDQGSSRLQKKARLILTRRDDTSGAWFYFKRQWRLQTFYILLYLLGPVYMWSIGFQAMAIAFAGYGIGSKLRDIRWWRALAREWPDTQQFLDWEKITAIANEPDWGRQ